MDVTQEQIINPFFPRKTSNNFAGYKLLIGFQLNKSQVALTLDIEDNLPMKAGFHRYDIGYCFNNLVYPITQRRPRFFRINEIVDCEGFCSRNRRVAVGHRSL